MSSPNLRRFSLPLAPHRRVFAAFFLYAFAIGGFFPRLAELQRSMRLSEGELGLGLIGAAFGTLISLTLAGRLIERVGHRSTLLVLMPALSVFYAFTAHASGAVALFLCLLPAGLCIGAIELVVNLEADRVEHQSGRRIMNRSHAFWSFGFFGAGLLGALAARLGISPQWQLAGMVPLSALLILLLLGGFEAAPHRSGSNDEPAHHFARPTLAIMGLVVFSLSGLVLEGAGIDWSAIYMRDVFAAAPFISGLAVATGAFAQGAARYVADRFVERHSPLAIARTLLVVLGAGHADGDLRAGVARGAARLRADGRGHQRDVSAGDVGRRSAHRSAGRHQRGGAGADLVRRASCSARRCWASWQNIWASVGPSAWDCRWCC